MTNEWTRPEHVMAYLERMTDIPHRMEGEATLLSEVPATSSRILDLGCGDGHLLALLMAHCEKASGVGLDFSPTMLEKSRQRFASNGRVRLVEHNMDDPLPELGAFDCVVSSFAIHHCDDRRKRELYEEVWATLVPGGLFCNLEHVASPNQRVHERFLHEMGIGTEDEDPSNQLLDVETQLGWLRQIGFDDVDCYWRWRELALILGRKPPARTGSSRSVVDEPVLDDAPLAGEMAWLSDRLDGLNATMTGRRDFKPLQLVLRDGDGAVVGGLKAQTGWDWLHVELLWVREDRRGRGYGSRLLAHAETEARRRGCSGACLSSFSFQAPEFYRRFGYAIFGKIDEYPQDHTMFFFSKRWDTS